MSFIDLCATLRLPRAPDEEDARTLAAAARAGGFSVVVVSPRGQEAVDVDSLGALIRVLDVAAATSGVCLVPALAPLLGTELSDIVSMMKSLPTGTPRVLRLRAAVDDALLLSRIGAVAAAAGAVVVVPSFDASLMRGAVAVEGSTATRLGLPCVPEASEHIAISRIIEVTRLTGARFHIAGVFSARGAALIEGAAGDGLVSGSVFASHLLVDDTALLALRYDTRLLMRPPVPTASSRAALLAAVKAGVLMVATGHHAVPKRERDLEMTRATPGLTSLASTGRLLSALLGRSELLRALSSGPAAVLGLPVTPQPAEANGNESDDLSRLVTLVAEVSQ